ncbi:MAG: shikimate dehydrogenase [Rhodospirillaceae bacterium]
METVEKFSLAAVIGWPIMHSRSPLMHNYWMRQQGIKGTYIPLAIEPGKVPEALRAMPMLGFSGCNVTIPHKLVAKETMDEVDEAAEKMGAISCVVVREDGSLFGTNNDWIGFLRNLQESHPEFELAGKTVTVLGAGGGARAVCYGLIQAGVNEINVVNRTRDKAENLKQLYGDILKVWTWEQRSRALEGADLVVNATCLGMVGMEDHDIEFDALAQDAVVYDIIYTPRETNFIKRAARKQNRTCSGLGMLLHQGPVAWKYWFGIEPTVTRELYELLAQDLESEYGE